MEEMWGLRVEGEDSEELGVNLFKMHCVHFSKKLFSFFFLKKEFALQTLEVFCPWDLKAFSPEQGACWLAAFRQMCSRTTLKYKRGSDF